MNLELCLPIGISTTEQSAAFSQELQDKIGSNEKDFLVHKHEMQSKFQNIHYPHGSIDQEIRRSRKIKFSGRNIEKAESMPFDVICLVMLLLKIIYNVKNG